jgi:hypothetical protein
LVLRQSLTRQLYYRELKLDVRNASVLASNTVETALQEIAALVLASAVIARLRISAAQQLKMAPARLSFFKVMLATQTLWSTFAMLGATLTTAQRAHLFDQYMERFARQRCCRSVESARVRGYSDNPFRPGHARPASALIPDRSRSQSDEFERRITLQTLRMTYRHWA